MRANQHGAPLDARLPGGRVISWHARTFQRPRQPAREMSGRLSGTRFVDIGFPASLILGAIAAVAILYFFPPVVEKIVAGENNAPPKTTHEYDLIKLVALSLIVGSAGPAFLATAQSRVMSAINAQRADTAVQTGKTQVDQVAESLRSSGATDVTRCNWPE